MPKGDAQAKIAAAAPVAGKGKNLMAVRHEVENLIRRGNIFYWRSSERIGIEHPCPMVHQAAATNGTPIMDLRK